MTDLLRACLAGLFAVASSSGLSVAFAEWRPDQRATYVNDCLARCLHLAPTRKKECDAYCGCALAETEAAVTPTDLDALERDMEAGRWNTTIMAMERNAGLCVRRLFGD
jgi:hypothetical protein